jgi:hypothetical protein
MNHTTSSHPVARGALREVLGAHDDESTERAAFRLVRERDGWCDRALSAERRLAAAEALIERLLVGRRSSTPPPPNG